VESRFCLLIQSRQQNLQVVPLAPNSIILSRRLVSSLVLWVGHIRRVHSGEAPCGCNTQVTAVRFVKRIVVRTLQRIQGSENLEPSTVCLLDLLLSHVPPFIPWRSGVVITIYLKQCQ